MTALHLISNSYINITETALMTSTETNIQERQVVLANPRFVQVNTIEQNGHFTNVALRIPCQLTVTDCTSFVGVRRHLAQFIAS